MLDVFDDSPIEVSGETWAAKSGLGDHPMTKVSWYGAAAYCADGGKRDSGDYGADIGLEQVGSHACNIAYVVADVVGHGRGVSWVVFWDALFLPTRSAPTSAAFV